MKIYKLQCLNEDGHVEDNGHYLSLTNAKIAKEEMDKYPMNTRYSIKQDIIEIETED